MIRCIGAFLCLVRIVNVTILILHVKREVDKFFFLSTFLFLIVSSSSSSSSNGFYFTLTTHPRRQKTRDARCQVGFQTQ